MMTEECYDPCFYPSPAYADELLYLSLAIRQLNLIHSYHSYGRRQLVKPRAAIPRFRA